MRFAWIVLLLAGFVHGAEVAIVPRPSTVEVRDGQFTLRATTEIFAQSNFAAIESAGNFFARHVRLATGFQPQVTATTRTDAPKNCIFLTTGGADANLGEEGYELEVTPDTVVVRAPKADGIFYGLQSLRQLLPPDIERVQRADNVAWAIPCVKITDKPRARLRGLMVDCSSTFVTREYLLRTIDLLALHKLNVLHLHLTDDEAWRFEVPGYPRLSNAPHYSVDDLRQIVEHGHAMHVMVIPEMDFPFHTEALARAYPNLTCNSSGHSPLCPGSDETIAFLNSAVDQLVDSFDAPYVYLAGQDVPKDVSEKCPLCQARMQAENLKDETALRDWLIGKVAERLKSKGRRVILETQLKGLDLNEPPSAIDFQHSYAAPLGDLGAEARIWTVHAAQDHLDEIAFPRLSAFAEDVWTVETAKDFDDFRLRLRSLEKRLNIMSVRIGAPR
jgi:hexosaminidase